MRTERSRLLRPRSGALLGFVLSCASTVDAGAQPTSVDVGPRTSPLPSHGDGVYGRFEGDLDTGIFAGVAHIHEQTSVELRTSLHYFSTGGLWFGAGLPLSAPVGRRIQTLAFGVDLRPAFLPRFSQNMQQGPAALDLLVDSISLSLGAYFGFPTEAAGDAGSQPEDPRGLELSLGAGLPLFGDAEGMWVEARGIGRFPDGDASAQFGGLVLLGWHELFRSPLTRRR